MDLDTWLICSREDCDWEGLLRTTGDDCIDPRCPVCGHRADKKSEAAGLP